MHNVWYWALSSSDNLYQDGARHGPFPSREEAISAACSVLAEQLLLFPDAGEKFFVGKYSELSKVDRTMIPLFHVDVLKDIIEDMSNHFPHSNKSLELTETQASDLDNRVWRSFCNWVKKYGIKYFDHIMSDVEVCYRT